MITAVRCRNVVFCFFFCMWPVLFISTKLNLTDSSEMLKRVHVVMLMQPTSTGLGIEIFTDVRLLKDCFPQCSHLINLH
jgi:hypothetical protein